MANPLEMSGFEEDIKELIVLSDLMQKQDFRSCFVTHFTDRVKALGNICSKVDVKIVQRLQLKLLDPLIFHLKTTSRSNDKWELVQAVIEVLKITPIHSVGQLFDVYTMTFFQIFKNANLPYKPSEELKECILECCTYLMENSSQSVLEEMYTPTYRAKFSLGISISVDIVKEERSTKLRLAALNFLLAASKFENQSNYNGRIITKIGDLFMFYLPGILAPLLEVILRDETQHHLVTMKALTCWGHVLCLVMKDSTETEKLSDSEIIKQWLLNQKGMQENITDISKGLKETKRTQLWLESAAVTLQPLITKLSDLRKHSHPKCRLELTLLMIKLLKNCLRNMKICLPVIIEVLVSSAVDEDPEVGEVAEKALNELDVHYDKENVGIFVPVLEDNLYSVINRLPRTLQLGNEQLLLLLLQSLSGYLRILGRHNRLQHLLSLSSTLKKLITVIKISFELELYPEISNQEFSVWEGELESAWYKPWKRFRHFASESVKTVLDEICHDLGNFGQPETIFDFLLEAYDEAFSFRKEVLLILNEVILGTKKLEDYIITQLLDFYLKPEHLCLPLQVTEDICTNLKEAQNNIIKVTLTMEGIGHLAKRTGKNFQGHLLKSLYYVLQRMGSSFSIIRVAATRAAIEIANACEFGGSVMSLIQGNIDYLTYHLTVKLRRKDASVVDVITVLIKNSSIQTMPNIEEIINSVLKSSSQNFDSPHTISYLRLLQIFVVQVSKWTKRDLKPPVSNVQHESDMDRLMKYLKDSTTTEKAIPEDEEEDTNMEEELQETEDCEPIPEEPGKPKLPRHLKITLAVANHCLHYLASRDNGKKLIVLEILNECVWALADWEDDLLPLVHNIWSPLTTKFDSITDPLIINRSFTLLCTLSFTAKDFVRARTLKNVLPVLESFLIKQAAKSKRKDSASGYFFTQNFKLQRELLTNLGKLTSSLRLFEKQTDLVVESALPYLSALQPPELQEKCKICFEDLKIHDKHLVWYKVRGLLGNPEFAKNAEIVLS